MRTAQHTWTDEHGWGRIDDPIDAQLVIVFGCRRRMERHDWHDALRAQYPSARIVGCSTAGDIHGDVVLDDSLVATAIAFEKSHVEVRSTIVHAKEESEAAGAALIRHLPREGLAHVLVLSDGQRVNGSALVRGMVSALPPNVAVTGGLAGDETKFERTVVCADAYASEGVVAVVGIYGSSIRVGYGSLGGWDPFGPERLVTGAEGNVLLKLDGVPALELYKRYLGEHAAGLPSTGLLFPLSVRLKDGSSVVRTILGVDEERQSLTFAGDVPEGSYARLMRANFDRLVDGAHGAAQTSRQGLAGKNAELAILISCVGRRLVLQQRAEEEVEAVRQVLGSRTTLTGFYSYGEICPTAPDANCELHNQTMTITTLSEA